MSGPDWIDAQAACALLGVKAQTLYAYVSRQMVRAQADTRDARRSLYARADVEALLRQAHRPRARAEVAARAIRWGDPVLDTALSEVRDGMLWLRGRSVADCAATLTLEGMAAHLWALPAVEVPPGVAVPPGPTPLGRALALLATAAEGAAPMQHRPRAAILAEAAALLSGVTDALVGRPGQGPLHGRLARAWGLQGAAVDDLRHALVLLADHELNPSTFAVRIAASTGASLPAALLAGMATLSGPRHGGVAVAARAALEAALAGEKPDDRLDGGPNDGAVGAGIGGAGHPGTALDRHLAHPGTPPPYGMGFGHPLYPEGDPRARLLLDRLPPDGPARRAVARLQDRLGLAPDIDAALAALSMTRALPAEAALVLFAAARQVGWIAHALEQLDSGEIIRPRARYVGPR